MICVGRRAPFRPVCEGVTHPCGRYEDVKEEPCRTAYHVETECGHDDCNENPEMKELCYRSRDPNRTAWLCRECAAEYHAYWDEMWSTYYSGLL